MKNYSSISSISLLIQSSLEKNFSNVKLKGEISSLTKHISGHIYFTLKDDYASIDCICWKFINEKYKSKIIINKNVLCNGKITSYAPRSKYQFILSSLSLDGEGEHALRLEILKKQLAAEGLFEESRKKKLPKYPEKILIFTSESSAALQDIIKTSKNRFPSQIQVINICVQGDDASSSIVNALKNNYKADVAILARGGGSYEDLSIFNKEEIVRAVAFFPLPIITAIGHETDTMLVDYVSDKRAATPTASIEIALPAIPAISEEILYIKSKIHSLFQKTFIKEKKNVQEKMLKCLLFTNKIQIYKQKIQENINRIYDACFLNIKKKKIPTLNTHAFSSYRKNIKEKILFQKTKLHSANFIFFNKNEKLLYHYKRILQTLKVKNIINKGYSIVKKKSSIVSNISNIKKGDVLDIQIKDGEIKANVISCLQKKFS